MTEAPKTAEVAEHYRAQIREGVLAPGQRLPSTRDMEDSHDVSRVTIRRAMGWLQEEGYIVITQRGAYVQDTLSAGESPQDALVRATRTGDARSPGESRFVMSADMVTPPIYVANLFDIEPGEKLIRREYTSGRGGQGSRRVTRLQVDWYPAEFHDASELYRTERQAVHDELTVIAEHFGRRVTGRQRDDLEARGASEREARHLGLPIGSPVLAGVHRWSDDQGLIVYGEWVRPPKYVIGYEYTIA